MTQRMFVIGIPQAVKFRFRIIEPYPVGPYPEINADLHFVGIDDSGFDILFIKVLYHHRIIDMNGIRIIDRIAVFSDRTGVDRIGIEFTIFLNKLLPGIPGLQTAGSSEIA